MSRILEFISAHWVLVSFFVVAFIWLIIEESRHQGVGGARLTAQMATDLINRENAVVIDLRAVKDFTEGHIVGSINVAYTAIDQNKNKVEKFKNRPIIFVCASGAQSLNAMHKFKKLGFEKVYVLGGGLAAWKRANLPVVKG